MPNAPGTIILGDGVFAIGLVDIGITRGGGQLVVEREYREIEADGDFGPVKGRISKVKSVPKLTVNAMELLPANLPKMYAAIKNTTLLTVDTITGEADIAEADYVTVTWTGKTKAGSAVVITVENAINLENIDWALVDKAEIVASLTYTGTYLETARTTEPWSIVYTAAV